MISLGISFFSLFVVRALHYYGRHPAPTDEPRIFRLKMVWWGTVFLWGLVPLACGLVLTASNSALDCETGDCGANPVAALGAAAACSVAIVLIETVVVQCLPAPVHVAQDDAGELLPGAVLKGDAAAAEAALPLLESLNSDSHLA
jgi:hypothetical protein